jgi:hypothetical protein
MNSHTLPALLLLVVGVGVSLALVLSHRAEDADEPNAEVERLGAPVDRGEDVDPYGAYRTLVLGGPLYAGTVQSVTVKHSVQGPNVAPQESGVLQFRVERTVVGPKVKELSLGYWWMDDSNPEFLLGSWTFNDGPWRERPRAGQHLLLLLAGTKFDADDWTRRFGSPVWHVWRGVGADHPFVQGFADAVRFLAAKDTKTQEQLFAKLCQSPFPSHRLFAFRAAFFAIDPDKERTVLGRKEEPRRQAQRILHYLRVAVPRMTEEKERWAFTSGLGVWVEGRRTLPNAHQVPEVMGPVQAAFEDWYLTELGAIDRPVRCSTALSGLNGLIKELGTAEALTFFKKRGRAALEQQLRACARARDEDVQELSREILDKLSKH